MLPQLRNDLIFSQKKNGTWNVFDPVRSKHFLIGEQERGWLLRLDGTITFEEMRKIVPRENAEKFFRLIRLYGLLIGPPVKTKKVIRLKYDLLSFRPSLLCEMSEVNAHVIRNGLFIFSLISLALIITLLMLFKSISPVQQHVLYQVPQFNILEVPKIICALLLVSVFHESAHVIVARSYGVFVARIGLMLLGGQPLFFADVSAMRQGTTSFQRLLILLAGIAANIVLSVVFIAIAGIIESNSRFLYYVSGISITMAIFNLIPFFEYDGYYILADCLGIPDLSYRAAHSLKNGLRSQDAVVQMYLLGALAFRWGLSWSITSILLFVVFSMKISWLSLGYACFVSFGLWSILMAFWVFGRR